MSWIDEPGNKRRIEELARLGEERVKITIEILIAIASALGSQVLVKDPGLHSWGMEITVGSSLYEALISRGGIRNDSD